MRSWIQFEEELDIGIDEPDIIVVSGEYLPSRPAPHCMNHDSPAFSDSGDPIEIEISGIIGQMQDEYYAKSDIYDRIVEMLEERLDK
jgi:hypothetical protein